VEDEVGEAVVTARRGLRPREEDRPLRVLRVAGPHLLAAHAEAVAVGLGQRAHGGEVAARVRLAEELTPDLVAGEDGRKEASLLRLGAVRDERRARVVDPDAVQQLRRARAGQLLAEDRLRGCGRAAAAVLARPEEADVPGLPQPALPGAQKL